jgi:hypothetical protein
VSISIAHLSPLPPNELLIDTSTRLTPVTGAPGFHAAPTDVPSTGGLSMGGYSMVSVPIPELATSVLVAAALLTGLPRKSTPPARV